MKPVLGEIYLNQNGDFFNAFLNDRREPPDREQGQTREEVTYALTSTSALKSLCSSSFSHIFHLLKGAPLIELLVCRESRRCPNTSRFTGGWRSPKSCCPF
jgi:hypothetical protein